MGFWTDDQQNKGSLLKGIEREIGHQEHRKDVYRMHRNNRNCGDVCHHCQQTTVISITFHRDVQVAQEILQMTSLLSCYKSAKHFSNFLVLIYSLCHTSTWKSRIGKWDIKYSNKSILASLLLVCYFRSLWASGSISCVRQLPWCLPGSICRSV